MPSPNTLALPRAARECGPRWTCHSSERWSGRLYVHDRVTKRSLWLDDVCRGYRCYMEYLADAAPEQNAGGFGDETGSLQPLSQPLRRDFLQGCCRRTSCRYRHGLLPEDPVPEQYAAAVAAPVPPSRGNAAANPLLRGICKDYARGHCKRGEHCNLQHVAVPWGACTHFFLYENCKYGERCKFWHATLSDATFDAAAETQPRDERSGQACHLRQ